jgi:hypothetical protein
MKEKDNDENVILDKKIIFKEIWCVVVDWIHLAASPEQSNESLRFHKCGEILSNQGTISFSRRMS